MIHVLRREQVVKAPMERIWAFFSDPHNLNTLTPPDLSFRIVSETADRMYEGQMIEYRVSFMKGIWSKWLTEITHVSDRAYFVDEQRIGPYKLWHHEHWFIPEGESIRLVDKVTFVVGFGPIGDLLALLWIRRKLNHIFDYRLKKTAELFGN